MIKFSDFNKALKTIGTLRTSTGDTFDVNSAGDALIRLSYLKAEVERAEKAIKERLPEDFSYENEMGKISVSKTATYSQNVPAIVSALTEKGIDWQGLVKFRKSGEGVNKTVKAVIESNETLESESTTFRITKKDTDKADFDFTLE